MQTVSYENEFNLNESEPLDGAKANSEMAYLRSTLSVERLLLFPRVSTFRELRKIK